MKTLIKVCGVTTPIDARAVSAAEVDFIGLNFYRGSSRCVTPARAAEIAVASGRAKRVGVFVNPDPVEVRAVLDAVQLDLLQFHGSETPELCASFNMPFIKTVGVSDTLDFPSFAKRYSTASAFLLDVDDAEQHGGTGRTFDWDLWPESAQPLILSGGLTPENVGTAISRMHPWAVDVASGVEGDAVGRKEPARLAAFVSAVRKT